MELHLKDAQELGKWRQGPEGRACGGRELRCDRPRLKNRNGASFRSAAWPGREPPGGTVCVWLTLALSRSSETQGVGG